MLLRTLIVLLMVSKVLLTSETEEFVGAIKLGSVVEFIEKQPSI